MPSLQQYLVCMKYVAMYKMSIRMYEMCICTVRVYVRDVYVYSMCSCGECEQAPH